MTETKKKVFPVLPANPHRTCWGCDLYCAANAMRCGNGSDRTQHPSELWGPDWQAWGSDFGQTKEATADSPL